MGHFFIDGFDFGVDATRSSLSVVDSKLDLRVVGDDAVIAATMVLDDHPWNWLIQPPFLYAIGVPCEVNRNGDLDHEITEQELDDYDIALYAGEHCDVIPCKVSKKGKVVTVTGVVHGIRASPLKFHAQFTL
jgi:hypothetical protein